MRITSGHILPIIAIVLAIISLAPAVNAATITVPTDCPTINGAIANASAGDTIYVQSGTYHENVVVNKQITLIGKDTGAGQPVIMGTGAMYSDGIDITANGATIQGFNLTDWWVGIMIHSDNNNVTGNTANNNEYGIDVYQSSNNNVTWNMANNNVMGITIEYLCNNNVTGNTANNNQYGIEVYYSSNNNVTGNKVQYNTNNGIYIDPNSRNNVLWLNVIQGNAQNALDAGMNNRWNSTIPLSYLYDGQMYTNYTGNYWGNYNGPSVDGIGVKPYNIPPGSTDLYPMVLVSTPVENLNTTYCYPTIQSAINDAGPGNIIQVSKGTYKENVVVNKNISLVGDTSGTMPVVDGMGGTAITITADGVTLKGLNATNASYGIMVRSNNNNVTGNDAYNNTNEGFILILSSNNNVTGNTAKDNANDGIALISSSNYNTVTGNTVKNNTLGIRFDSSNNNDVKENTASYNVYNNIILVNSNNNNVTGNMANGNVTNINNNGIYLYGSSNNNISGNTANNNGQSGIALISSSNYNTVIGNTVDNNSYGICIMNSSSNNVTSNDFLYNGVMGIDLYDYSAGNVLWLNVIRGSFMNGNESDGYSNTWNSTVPMSYTYNGQSYTNYTGNYWGDYIGTGEYHGIGYPPYTINANNIDHYPMVSPIPLVAGFTANVTSGVTPLTVSFNDTSSGYVSSWNWSFGDGSANVTTRNASYTYYAPGSYTVVLTVADSTGVSSSASKVIIVSPASFTVPLKQGWNLVSFPLVNYTIRASSLGSIGVTDVAAFNSSTQSYDEYYNMSFSTLAYDFTLRPERGYFIKSSRDTSLIVTGAMPVGRSVSLCYGWNLVGWSTYDHSTASAIVALLPNNQTVARFSAVNQSFDVFAEHLSTSMYDFDMKSGEGYFINSTGPATLNYGVI